MENFENSITKFNGQYLKCVVSNYTSSKNLLANSGSLIVIQPKSGKLNDIELAKAYKNGTIHRNYVYLGNEFLASGFGFAAQEVLEKAENIVKNYDDDINKLVQKDAELNQKIDDKISEVYEEISNYVKTEGGHIENTYVTLNGHNILTKDIILYGEEAKYKDLTVDDVKITIDNNECLNDEVLLPIGSIIHNVEIIIDITKNDSDGLRSLQVLHNMGNDDEAYEGTKVLYDLDTDITIDADYDKYRIFYNKTFSDGALNGLLINRYKKEVLKSLYINVKGTSVSNYKPYPLIYKKYNINLISSGNAIQDHTIDMRSIVNIRPQYYIKYSEDGTLEQDKFTGVCMLNSFNDYDRTTVRIPINASMNTSGSICIAVPSNFTLSKLNIIKDGVSSFNWTGAISIIKGKKMKCINTDTSNPYYINFDIYFVKASNGFYEFDNSSYQMEAVIIYNYAKDMTMIDGEYDNIPTKNVSSAELSLNDTSFLNINDEDFNNLYWINYNHSYSPNIDSLKDRLSESNINGAVKS